MSLSSQPHVHAVASVKRKKSIKLLRENLCLYMQESLELGESLWIPMDWNTRGGASG